jgi:hypothetical protein
MRAHHLKNILNLFKKNVNTFNIYCKSNEELIIHLLDESTKELIYHFELMSNNTLTLNKSYVLCVNDLCRLFKYVKSEALVKWEQTDTNIIIKIITSLDMSQTLQFPKIETETNGEIKCYDNFICNPKVSVRLSDFSRIIKSLKNTSDNYIISYDSNKFIIRNCDAVIPICYTLSCSTENTPSASGLCEGITTLEGSETTLSNNCLLKLNKLSSDNTLIEIGRNFISGFTEGELKYYIQFVNLS